MIRLLLALLLGLAGCEQEKAASVPPPMCYFERADGVVTAGTYAVIGSNGQLHCRWHDTPTAYEYVSRAYCSNGKEQCRPEPVRHPMRNPSFMVKEAHGH